MKFLTFKLGMVEYAVDVGIVESVVEYGGSIQVPSPLPYMLGVMDLRGQSIPIVGLGRKLGLQPLEGTIKGSVIIFAMRPYEMESKAVIVGALVDEVCEVLTIDMGGLEGAHGEGAALWEPFVLGVAHHEGRMIVVIKPEGLFSLTELGSMAAA